jgi:hypothetical protein
VLEPILDNGPVDQFEYDSLGGLPLGIKTSIFGSLALLEVLWPRLGPALSALPTFSWMTIRDQEYFRFTASFMV